MSTPHETQPALFDLEVCERHLLAIAKRDQDRFTGTTIEKHAETVGAVLAAVAAGVPREHIAKLAGISTKTIAGIVERAEANGEIAGWKQRMSRLLGRAAESAAASLAEDLDSGKITPGQKTLTIAILTDKRLLLDGEATSRVEHVQRVTPEQLMEEMKRATVSIT